jgi:probable HAF family extracellular repeat protein
MSSVHALSNRNSIRPTNHFGGSTKYRCVLVLGLAVLAAFPLPAKAQVTYTFTTLDDAADPTFNQLLGINDSQIIAGYFGMNVNKGYVLSPPFGQNSYRNENFPGSVQTQVTGINNSGTTVGFYIDAAGTNHGFVDHVGTFFNVDFPNTTFNQLLGLNDLGVVAGFFTDAEGNNHGYAGTAYNNMLREITIPHAVSNAATGVNNSGEIVGFYVDAAGVNHGFFLSGHLFQTLDFPGSTFTQALGVNNRGQVVGAFNDANGLMHGFVYTNGRFQQIDDPNGVGTTTINGINDLGDLVGFYLDAAGNTDGLLAVPQ